MKTSIDYLPENKRYELSTVVFMIREELERLAERAGKLQVLTEKICKEKIASPAKAGIK